MIRKIKKEEIHLLYPFVFRVFSDLNFSILKKVHGRDLKDIVVNAMQNPHYRYGYEHAWVYEEKNQILGVLFGYPSSLEDFVDGPLAFSLVEHGYPAMAIKEGKEALADEWLIDTIVVAPLFRDQGIGGQLLGEAERLAKDAGFAKIGVNCPAHNKIYLYLLEKQQYEEKIRLLIRDIPFLHMVKDI